MQLQRFDQIAHFQVWNPRWHDKKVLIACYKIDNAKTEHIKVTFPKSHAMSGDWYIARSKVKRCKKESNGTIMCYVVALGKLEPLEINQKDMRILL
jgi:hypothetical protein